MFLIRILSSRLFILRAEAARYSLALRVLDDALLVYCSKELTDATSVTVWTLIASVTLKNLAER